MQNVPCIWHPELTETVDVYVLFQCELELAEDTRLAWHLFGSSLYRAYVDGEEALEGPARFAPDAPEYDRLALSLTKGRHLLSVMVHNYGVHTRILLGGIAPFLQTELLDEEGRRLRLAWRCLHVDAFAHTGRRLNPQLGWPERCDMRRYPDPGLRGEGPGWTTAVEIAPPLGPVALRPKSIPDCLRVPAAARELARGSYSERFGYEDDDIAVRFLSRDLNTRLPAEGIWLRYDFGAIGLYRPVLRLDVPAGTVIEAGYAETLTDGKVFPVITLSAGASCHVDRWLARAGEQTLTTFSPRGFRYLELHIAAPAEQAAVREVSALRRTTYERTVGAFECDDPLLGRIWQMGADTLLACAEDALVDTPTRERGQWIGDAAAIGMEVMGVTVGELPLIRRSLQQASRRRREDGLAAGLCPGQEAYLTSYALYWISGCLRYARLTGDMSLLREEHATAVDTAELFWRHLTDRGARLPDTWDFLDWGHEVPADHVNVSLNLLLAATLRDLAAWERLIGEEELAARRDEQFATIAGIVRSRYINGAGLPVKSLPAAGDFDAASCPAGYHATAIALLYGLLPASAKAAAVAALKAHMLQCFPNDPAAPRLAHPSANHDRLITPSFGHYSLQALWEAGEEEFVLEQYRVCWGWMAQEGATTLLEVFDTRWSHCHAWSGAPTWQLSRYTLGLQPDERAGAGHYLLGMRPGGLSRAEGTVPLLHAAGVAEVRWRAMPDGSILQELTTGQALRISPQQGLRWRLRELIADGRQLPVGSEGEGEAQAEDAHLLVSHSLTARWERA